MAFFEMGKSNRLRCNQEQVISTAQALTMFMSQVKVAPGVSCAPAVFAGSGKLN